MSKKVVELTGDTTHDRGGRRDRDDAGKVGDWRRLRLASNDLG